MKCPFCGHPETQVLESRTPPEGNQIKRRRRCLHCQRRFLTVETVTLSLPLVVKRDGTRQAFEPEKIRRGFERALHKRSVSAEAVDEAIDDIIQSALNSGEREISVETLGHWVMERLQNLDEVAYIRFASVYKRFEHARDFHHVLTALEDTPNTSSPSLLPNKNHDA